MGYMNTLINGPQPSLCIWWRATVPDTQVRWILTWPISSLHLFICKGPTYSDAFMISGVTVSCDSDRVLYDEAGVTLSCTLWSFSRGSLCPQCSTAFRSHSALWFLLSLSPLFLFSSSTCALWKPTSIMNSYPMPPSFPSLSLHLLKKRWFYSAFVSFMLSLKRKFPGYSKPRRGIGIPWTPQCYFHRIVLASSWKTAFFPSSRDPAFPSLTLLPVVMQSPTFWSSCYSYWRCGYLGHNHPSLPTLSHETGQVQYSHGQGSRHLRAQLLGNHQGYWPSPWPAFNPLRSLIPCRKI